MLLEPSSASAAAAAATASGPVRVEGGGWRILGGGSFRISDSGFRD